MTREKIEDMKNEFWTVLEELVEDLEDKEIEVLEANEEYIVVSDEEDEDEEILIYLARANRTIWIEWVQII